MQCLKNLFLAVSLLLVATSASAQIEEPSFIGEVAGITADGKSSLLEKQRVVLKTKASVSMYIVGMGKTKSKINIKGGKSTSRFASGGPLRFVVKAVDNKSDPMSIISIFMFKANSKSRKAEVSSLSTFGGMSDNNMDYIPFTAKKFGESSYLIEVASLQPGEYGITVVNPNNKDEKNFIVSCFGVD